MSTQKETASSTSLGGHESSELSASSDISSICDSNSRDTFEAEMSSDSDSQTSRQEIFSPLSFLSTSLQQTTIECDSRLCLTARRRLSDTLEAAELLPSCIEESDNSPNHHVKFDASTDDKDRSSLSTYFHDFYPKTELLQEISTPSSPRQMSFHSVEFQSSSPRLVSTLSPRYTRKIFLSSNTPHYKVKRFPLPIFGSGPNHKSSEVEVLVGLSPRKKMQRVKSQTLLPCIRGSHPELNCISGETVIGKSESPTHFISFSLYSIFLSVFPTDIVRHLLPQLLSLYL
jgi:hypothetical protein